jgi:tRNA (cmo5U34)-methyltransferase
MTEIESRWPDVEYALAYLAKAETIPHRTEGEAVLLDHLPGRVERVLDLGCGDGRLLDLVLTARPGASGVALDFSPAMLDGARRRFAGDERVEVGAHDLFAPLPAIGEFDAVVSSFAIHHLADERKRVLYGEIFDRVRPGGVFLNLEHVASPTPELHLAFLTAIGVTPETEDPDNILAPVEDQLAWLRDLGFVDVDCHWKWLELALLAGVCR